MPIYENSLAVMFWAGGDPTATLEQMVSWGVRSGQMGIPGDYDLSGPALAREATAWRDAAQALGFQIYTVFAAYDGESYADVEAVRQTVGFVPAGTRAGREARTLTVSEFAYRIGVPAIATHIGCIPSDPHDPNYTDVLATVRRICDYCSQLDQNFALETGQEPAHELQSFLHAVNRGNLGINFDPANMILYGTGDPVEALGVLGSRVLSVHAKDGTWPAAPGELGRETPLGQGAVDWKRFLEKLAETGYRGPLAIEREASDPVQRLNDIKSGLKFLKELQLFAA